MSVPTLYRHLHTLRIKPVGVRQIPQRYPDDAGARILKHLGVTLTKSARRGGAR